MAFINCIIISTPQLKDRIRIRNEFIGLKLFNILNDLKTEAVNDTDLAVQIDVFDEQRESDESQLQGKFLLGHIIYFAWNLDQKISSIKLHELNLNDLNWWYFPYIQ